MIKKIGIGFACVAALAILAVFVFQKQFGTMLFERAVERNIGADAMSGLEDGLHIGLCGTGSPLANLDRAGPCNIVIAGERLFVVDIGEGGGRNLTLMGIDGGEVEGLFLTHFHSDHIDGMGPLMLNRWVRGTNIAPLPVHGPVGVDTVVDGFNAAYATDNSYRTAHHGEGIAPPSGAGAEARPFEMEGESAVVYDQDGLEVTAFEVDHHPVEPAVGYRFDYKGRSICISGDTVRSANLERMCTGVDLLVHEALQMEMVAQMQDSLARQGAKNVATIMADIRDYHASPQDAAQSAEAAGARMLVLSHLVPPLPSAYLYPAFLGDAEERFDGDLVVGEDGMFFSLPAGGDGIGQTNLM